MAVVGEAVQRGVRRIEADGVLGGAQIDGEQRVEHPAVESHALNGERAEDAFRDVGGDFFEAAAGRLRGDGLVLVVVALGEIDLADGFG